MGHQVRPPLAFIRSRARLLFHALYPSFVLRRTVVRPLSLVSMTFVLTLIFIGFYLVVPFTLLPHVASRPFPTLLWLVAFIWCIACTVVSYILTALALPGRVPLTWRPQATQLEPSLSPGMGTVEACLEKSIVVPVPPPEVLAAGTAMLDAEGRYRFCKICNVFKPDRAHHCSACRECVLLMDHHCPFTGNSCIGLLNRKFFILFLYYATVSCILVATLTPRAIIAYLFEFERSVTASSLAWTVALLMGYMLCVIHAVALAPFSAFHTYLVLKNRTTIETQETQSALHLEILRRNDRGRLSNWKATFGPTPWLWFLPVSYGREYDGLRWQHTATSGDLIV